MATKAQVIAKIDTINDNGNNTAREVREVLNEILNYTENVPFPETEKVEFFHFWTEDKPVVDKMQNTLWYSIKGIKDQWVNITFNIRILNPEKSIQNASSIKEDVFFDNIYIFPLADKDIEVLNYLENIVPLNMKSVRFIIPYTASINGQIMDYPLSTSIYFREKNIVFDFNYVIGGEKKSEMGIEGGKAFSSVSFHCPPFNFLNG
ncbi:hypothetical protein H9Q08_11315 [Chryseobacterium sp. PS-8]|uniref:Uncharacterized protein n=1 Tax=Chryseobacterium indicum TaxID=2766954 RepID=A0ABS9C7W8_9FLAO|nr:hypothetical protein [Chryseobacterium sp. PS-8]MCF2219898.1 hypothetical protein [Chryseobacterium sp. PS-8]